MSLLTLSTITGYARTSSSLSAIGTAVALGFKVRVNGAYLLNSAATASPLILARGATNTRLQIATAHAGSDVFVALTGSAGQNPQVAVTINQSNFSSGAYYVIRGWAGPGGATIEVRDSSNNVIGTQSVAGVTLQNSSSANGLVWLGDTADLTGTTGIIDGAAVYSQEPPANINAPHPDDTGILWGVLDEHGNIVWGATQLDDLNNASWGAGGAWDAPAPVVTSIDPDEGSESGGTAVTISGQYFRAGATVEIGGNAATGVTVEDDSEITCTTPAGSEGAADVTVENPDGQSDTLENGFTFTSDTEPLSPGTATLNRTSGWMVEVEATAASGGVGPISMHWQRSPRGADTWSNLSGQTALLLRDRTVTPETNYDYRLAYTDGVDTAFSNVVQADVPAQVARWITLGDSQTDEYKADDNRISSGPWQGFVLNWLEQLAQDEGQPFPATHTREVDIGTWGTRAEPRRTGFERNLARSGSQMDDVVADQLALAESIIEGGDADVAILFGTGNEWGNPFQTPYLLSLIYNGNGTLDSQGVPVTTRMETLFGYYDTVMSALAPILPAGLVVVMPPDYGSFPMIFASYPDATRRGYVTSAIEYLHGLIEARAEAINVAEDRTAVVTIPYDHYILPDIWGTADGTYVTVAGVQLNYAEDSTDGSPLFFTVTPQSGTGIPHAHTIPNGIIANTVLTAVNQLPGFSIPLYSDAEILENAGIEAEDVEGGSATSVEVVAVGAGSKTASAGSASGVDVVTAGAGSKTASAGSAVTVDVDAQGAGSKTALAGSASVVDIATAGSGAKAASGGSASSVAIVAAGAGTAEETASGGSAVTVSIAATGDGTKAAQGASPAGVDVSAQGSGAKAVSGGSGASVGVVASGGGTAAEGVSGGSVALVDVLAAGDGAKATSGGVATDVAVSSTGAGSKHASGGSVSSLSVTATGGGTAEEVPPEGGSDVTVYVLTSGGGLKAVSLGSATLVSLVASGAGQKHASGGSAARVNVYTSAGGGQVLPFDVHPRNIIAGYGPGFVIADYGPGRKV